jgi:hypothetical protein
LYSKRIETVRWFEAHAPDAFDLFGVGWQNSAVPFPSYRGRVVDKIAVLSKYKFSICYENVGGLQGYVTEKIFDCFFAGCVPIYWGAENIFEYIPPSCFIDRREYPDHESLYCYLRSMSESDYIEYQISIKEFLDTNGHKDFKPESFASHIAKNIVFDLNGTSKNP